MTCYCYRCQLLKINTEESGMKRYECLAMGSSKKKLPMLDDTGLGGCWKGYPKADAPYNEYDNEPDIRDWIAEQERKKKDERQDEPPEIYPEHQEKIEA